MNIEQLKKKLENESKGNKIKYDDESGIISLDGKEIGQWNDNANQDYPEDLIWRRDISGFHHQAFKAGHESATNRLLPLLEKAVEMAEFYSDELKHCVVGKKYGESDVYVDFGKKAREFLSEFTKMTEIKKESE